MSFTALLSHLNLRSTHLFPSFKTIVLVCLFSLISLTAFSFIKSTLAATDNADTLIQRRNDGIKAIDNVDYLANYISTGSWIDLLQIVIGNTFSIKNGFFSWTPGGVVGGTNQFIGQLYNPPASGIQYIAQTWDGFLGKPAYAQGAGFIGLQPILPVWSEFRNIAYALSSLFFIIIGMMIILRVKISPQATITIQNAIPQLVTTLILITFSYAIAGLLIDLTYVIQGMVAIALFPDNNNTLLNAIGQIPFIGKLFPSFGNMVEPNFQTVISTLFFPAMSTVMLSFIIGFAVNGLLGPFTLLGAAGTAVSGIAIIVILIILFFGILIWLFKFLIGLLKCYAMVLFKIIIAPLEIGMGAFPNSKVGFSSWFLDLISNLFVFPISFIFLLLANKIILSIIGQSGFVGFLSEIVKLLTGAQVSTSATPNLWVPSLLGGSNGTSGMIIAAGAIGLSTLMLLSKLPDMIPQYIFMLKPSPWGDAIGKSLDYKNLPFSRETEAWGKGNLGALVEQAGENIQGGRYGRNKAVNWFGRVVEDAGGSMREQYKRPKPGTPAP